MSTENLSVEDGKNKCQEFLDNKIDESTFIPILQQIDEFSMNIDTLKETKIGTIMSKLSTQKTSQTVSSKATEILNKWKKDLKPTNTSSTSNLSISQEAKPNIDSQELGNSQEITIDLKRKLESSQTNSPSALKIRKVDEAGIEKQEVTKKEASSEKIFTGTIPHTPQRNTFQIRFWEALKQSSKDEEETIQLAIQIENELFLEYGKKQKEYPQKFRSLFTNLKDPLNKDLREALFSGAIFPSELVHLSHEDLANPTLKDTRKKIVDEATQAAQGVKPSVSSLFTCGRCKKNETSYYQMQTRSADEPMTCFITCVNCGHHWKMC
jgi:transcription elongation factor S-II